MWKEREFVGPPSQAKNWENEFITTLFITHDVLKLSQIIIISDRFDNSFDIKKHRYFFVFQRSEMTNQPTVSSWSCLSTLIYLLISTVSEQKPGNNTSEGDPASRRDWHLAGKRVRNALCTSSTHPSLRTSTWPSIRAGGGCCKQK